MSDKTGDTSAPSLLRASSAPNNNPLLSAAITNLTLDDFTHNAMLLPAASPFERVAPQPPPQLLPSAANVGLSTQGSPSVVFAGSGATVASAAGLSLNPETFSEISLDYNADDGASSTKSSSKPATAAAYVASGQSATIAAVNLLPIVASTVFSSFSNIISGITSDTPTAPAAQSPPTPPQQQQQHHQQQYHHHQAPPDIHQLYPLQQQQQQPPPPPVAFTPVTEQFYPQPTAAVALDPTAGIGQPPRLYSPHEAVAAAAPPTFVLPPSGLQPPSTAHTLHSVNNTYRLNQKRKIYAPLPGLNTTHVPVHPSADVPYTSFPASVAQQPPAHFAQPPPSQPQHQPPPPAASPFSLSALIHKVPLLDKFQQLAVSPAAPVSNARSDSAHGLDIGNDYPVQNLAPLLETPSPLTAQQQSSALTTPSQRKTSITFAAPPSELPQHYSTAAPHQTSPYAPVELQQPPPPIRKTSTPSQQTVPNPIYYLQPELALPSQPATVALPPSVPPTAVAHLPPPSTGSSYRLRGKPLYKSPNTYGTVATVTQFQPPAAPSASAYPASQLYNPLQSSGVPTTHQYVAPPTQPLPVLTTVPVAFFNPTSATAVVSQICQPPVVPESVAYFTPVQTPTVSALNPTSSSNELLVPPNSNSLLNSVQDNAVLPTTDVVTSDPIRTVFNQTTNLVSSSTVFTPADSVPIQDNAANLFKPHHMLSNPNTVSETNPISFFSTTTSNVNYSPVQNAEICTSTTANFFNLTPSQSAPVNAPIETPQNEYVAHTQQAEYPAATIAPAESIASTPFGEYTQPAQSDQSAAVSAGNPSGGFNPFAEYAESKPIVPTQEQLNRFSVDAPADPAAVEPFDDPTHFFCSPPEQNITTAPELFNIVATPTQSIQHAAPDNTTEIVANPTIHLNATSSSIVFQSTIEATPSHPIDFFNYHSSEQQPSAPFNPFGSVPSTLEPESAPVVVAAAARETPFDNYITLEQQTRSSFIHSNDNSLGDTVDIVPNVDLPDLLAPTHIDSIEPAAAVVDANLNIEAAPLAVSTPAPVASSLFQATHNTASIQNTFASFFDTPAANANGNVNNWFNPIATPQSEQTAAWSTTASQNTNTPVHKPNPTDPISFFNPAPVAAVLNANVIPTSAAAPAIVASTLTAPTLDIVNNSQIANFFNNPPPLPDDATQQQLDLVKDCNRNFQASVNQNHIGVEEVVNHEHATAVGRESAAPQIAQQQLQQQQHRRLGEVSQHFAAFAGGVGIGGASSEFGIDTRSFASSNVVEPASSIQSEFSEYAVSLAGNQSFVGQTPNGEEDNEVQRFLEPLTHTTADHLDGTMAASSPTGNIAYRPVCAHWFYNAASVAGDATTADVTPVPEATTPTTPNGTAATPREPSSSHAAHPPHAHPPHTSTTKSLWTPFSAVDSQRLQHALDNGIDVCTTNGGRFDVHLSQRRREPVYWRAAVTDEVRRCSWFYKGADSRLVPYEESTAAMLELEYRQAAELGQWQRKVALPGGETVVLHGPGVLVHFNKSQTPESWTENATAPVASRPRIVKRGVDEFVIEEGESDQVDHLMFMVHGIGAACDLKFRTVEQVVEEFRSTAHHLVQSHYRSAIDAGRVGRIEVLPISWHSELHSAETGIDEKLRAITLESIPKLRLFTNSTLLDILFYTSPVFCQQIIDAVAGSINQKYQLYCERNPRFGGAVSLAGHSLGSVIVFDLLQNQQPSTDESEVEMEKPDDGRLVAPAPVGLSIGQAGTGQQSIIYPQLLFKPRMFFAFGSPIGMFVTVRGIHSLGLDYKLPTCGGFYNIFHPYDPVAYRIEALINAALAGRQPVLIPHHKGRKRMHLELRETIQRVGNDIKQRVVETFRSTMNRVYNLSPITLPMNIDRQPEMQLEVDEVLERERQLALDAVETATSSASSQSGDADDGCTGAMAVTEAALGRLNGGRRVDYVLQEAPLEFFNEYLFALTSHVCYWESADTTLFIAKEIYASMGVHADHKQPPPSTMIVPPHDS